jgi:tRNA-dihydrouridine synthase C
VFWQGVSARVATRHRAGRLKQWLNYMRRVYPEAQQAFDELRLVHDAGHIERWLASHGSREMGNGWPSSGERLKPLAMK